MFDFSLKSEAQFVGDILNQLPNATLTFKDAKDTGTIDISYQADGNPVIESADIQTTTLSLYLVQRAIPGGTFDVSRGADLETVYFEGRLVEPKTYPLPIQAQGDITAIINGQQGRVTSVRAFSTPTAQAFNYDLQMGQKLGLFVQFFQGTSS